MRRSAVLLIFVIALLFGLPAAAAVAPSGPPTSIGKDGAAASVETLATQAAIDTLKAGGNAVDAAVAAAAVLGDGSMRIVTNSAAWASLNTDIATVSSIGLVTTLSTVSTAGTVTITATYQGTTGSVDITVN